MSALLRRIAGPAIITILVGTALIYAISQSPDLREVAGEASWMVFSFFTSPFILESSVALLGLIIVVSWNQWRIRKEGDGWVDMVPEKAPPAEGEKPGP